ncbi:MAG: LysR substrate-binding domain-containing protein [Pseudomonadota bacterium]
MRYTLRQLEVFLAVAQHQSVSRAAEGLSMSQSAVSGALADLERQFDIQLFERLGKRLQLSELGRSLRARAEALQQQARELENELASHDAVGQLRVGATLSIGNHLMVPEIARFMREHPTARVTLDVANTVEIARKVLNFEIDIGLVEGELQEPELQVTRWRPDELVVFCAPEHAFATQGTLSDADLVQASWIVREPGSGTRQAFERAMHGILPDLKIVLELQHTEAIKSAVEAGLGVGCVSRVALGEAFRHGSLIPCRVPQRDFHRWFYSVLHERKYQSAAVLGFLAQLRAGMPTE